MLAEIEKNALEILTHFNSVYWEQFRYHREKEYHIFIWTSAILLAGIAGLLVIKQGEVPIYTKYGAWGHSFATLAVLVWLAGSVWMQRRERTSGNQYVNVIKNIATELGGFEGGQPTCVLPSDWKDWTSASDTGFRFNFVPISCLVGLLAIALIWAPWFG